MNPAANFIKLFGLIYATISVWALSFDSGYAARGVNYAEIF